MAVPERRVTLVFSRLLVSNVEHIRESTVATPINRGIARDLSKRADSEDENWILLKEADYRGGHVTPQWHRTTQKETSTVSPSIARARASATRVNRVTRLTYGRYRLSAFLLSLSLSPPTRRRCRQLVSMATGRH